MSGNSANWKVRKKRPKSGKSRGICVVREIHDGSSTKCYVFRWSCTLTCTLSYCNSFFLRDVHRDFGLINVHLFDMLPANLFFKKAGKSWGFFFCLESDSPDYPYLGRCNKYWSHVQRSIRSIRLPLGKKQRVLRIVRPCYQDRWHRPSGLSRLKPPL